MYVELLDEGVAVFRPVEAQPEPDGSFTLSIELPVGERWRFESGSRVVCERQDIGGDEPSLVAVRLA